MKRLLDKKRMKGTKNNNPDGVDINILIELCIA